MTGAQGGDSPAAIEAAAGHRGTVLVADDEESMRFFLKRALTRRGFETYVAKDGEAALALLSSRAFDAAVVDLRMPRLDGIEVVARARSGGSTVPFIVMTAYGTIPSAVESMRRGAFDFVTKPLDADDLVKLIDRARREGSRPEGAKVRAGGSESLAVDHFEMIAKSRALDSVRKAVASLAKTSATVLVTGESGTGKEVVARAIHERSTRAGGPFVAVNCAAIPSTLFESELFGHVAGAFTGAFREKRGLVHGADGGTLFLDEIGEIDLATQAKLVRFLQVRAATPVGGTNPVAVDVRIVAATQVDLERAVDEGRFRRDLHGRLAVVGIALPPLRERSEDVPDLVRAVLSRVRRDGSASFTSEALEALSRYRWPGNIRQLENVVERIAVLNPEKETLDLECVPEEIRTGPPPFPAWLGASAGASSPSGLPPYRSAHAAFERDFLLRLFEEARGNITHAARLAGLSRANLHRKLKQFGIDADRFRGGRAPGDAT